MKEKCKRNTPKLLGHIKSSPKKKIIALYAYIKKKKARKSTDEQLNESPQKDWQKRTSQNQIQQTEKSNKIEGTN